MVQQGLFAYEAAAEVVPAQNSAAARSSAVGLPAAPVGARYAPVAGSRFSFQIPVRASCGIMPLQHATPDAGAAIPSAGVAAGVHMPASAVRPEAVSGRAAALPEPAVMPADAAPPASAAEDLASGRQQQPAVTAAAGGAESLAARAATALSHARADASVWDLPERRSAAEEGISSSAGRTYLGNHRPDLIGSEPVFPEEAPRTLAEAPLDIDPGRAYTASPEDWRDEIFYSVFLDRFARSPRGQTLGDPKSGLTRHGGDILGLISKLDYIKDSGATTIMLNPVILGVPEAYHGYEPLHLLSVDPQLGTMADFKKLVAEAHKRGLRIVFDLLINHVGPVFEYKDGSRWRGMDQPPKEIGVWNHKFFPLDLAQPENFTRHGVIEDWRSPEQSINGDFPPNYRHWASEKPAVQAMLIHVAEWWLKETDIDGFRIDAIRHIQPVFRDRFVKEIREYAALLGKKNLYLVGENSTGIDSEVARDLTVSGMDGAYNYPEYRRVNLALHGKAATRALEDSFNLSLSVIGSAAGRLLRFIDNHDTYRFLRAGEPLSILKVAMAFLFFSMGIPLVYYGTEQAFRQVTDRLSPEGPDLPADPENRPDMFEDGQYKFPSSQGDKFDADSEIFRHVRQLLALRKAHPALSRGEQYVRWSDPQGPGIYAFSRIYNGEEVVVAINTAQDGRSVKMYVDDRLTPPGVELTDAMDTAYKTAAYAQAGGGSIIDVSLPPQGIRVLVRRVPGS